MDLKKTRNGYVLPDLKRFKSISEEFLYIQRKKAQLYAKWELDFLWTRFRDMTIPELENLDQDSLTASELIIVKQIIHMVKSGDLTELNKVYDRVLGKPKEIQEIKTIDDTQLTIDILNPEKDAT